MEITDLVQVVFITHFLSISWVDRNFALKNGLYVSFGYKHAALAELRELVTNIQLPI